MLLVQVLYTFVAVLLVFDRVTAVVTRAQAVDQPDVNKLDNKFHDFMRIKYLLLLLLLVQPIKFSEPMLSDNLICSSQPYSAFALRCHPLPSVEAM